MKHLSLDQFRSTHQDYVAEREIQPFFDAKIQSDAELLQLLGFEINNIHGSIHQLLNRLKKSDVRAKAFCELAKRYSQTPFPRGKKFNDSKDIFEYFRNLREEKQQRLIVVLLDNLHRVQEEVEISIGTLNKVIIHPRDVFCPAIENRAAAVVCVKNKTTGDSTPSDSDCDMAQRLCKTGEILGIPLIDFLVIGDLEYYSLADEREL